MNRERFRAHVASRFRFLAVAMAGAYVILNALLAALSPLTAGWPTVAVTGLAVPPMVLAMVYAIIPVARHFGAPRG